MMNRTVTIRNQLGIHARPAGQFVRIASQYKSFVYIGKNGKEVNGKSIMGVLMLAAGYGTELNLRVEGDDEEAAMAALVDLVENKKFDEE
ncbi:MAG: HPr-like protein Crh [bacterium ADurb.Bin478]|nr:MAG: HPr-like protein Crh [bacterium ADurb.Bin478]